MASYTKSLLPGEKELADKLRSLVEPFDKQRETEEEQADIFYKLGHIYLQNAIKEQDGEKFTKASALFNAALVRTSNGNKKTNIQDGLVWLKKAILETFVGDELSTPTTLSQWEQRRRDNKQNLEKIRQRIKNECSHLEDIMDQYSIQSNDKLEAERVLVKEAKRLSLFVKEEMMLFTKMLWEQALENADLNPPCGYSLLALGSLARQEATPFSDLEFAILVEKQSDEIHKCFKKLTYLFHLIVLDLGETPLPHLAIASLNNFMTPGGDWFYDKVTPSGFKLDGAMPWACKTPVGRPATDTKAPLSLIRTPKEMADLQRVDHELGQAYHVADVLSRTFLVYGDHELHQVYHQEVQDIVESSYDGFRERGFINLKADTDRHMISQSIDQFGYLNAKVGIYRFPSTFVENLRLYFTPFYFGGSQWCTLDYLVEKGIISEEGAFNLRVGLATSLAFRLLTYFQNKGQYEAIMVFQDQDEDVSTNTQQAFMNNRSLYLRYEQTIYGILKTVLSRFGSRVEHPKNLLGEVFLDTKRKEALQTKSETSELHLKHNFMWAEANKDIPEFPCGINCGVDWDQAQHLDTSVDGIDSKLQTVDSMLQKIDQCVCVATLELHLKIYKYVLMKKANILTDLPNVSVDYVLGIMRESENLSIRDVFFLFLGLLAMASSSTDEKVIIYIINSAEIFLERTRDVPPLQRGFIQKLEIEFIYGLLFLYKLVGQTDKIITTCRTWIEKIEKPLRSKGPIPQLVYFYGTLSNALYRDPNRSEEAIVVQQKAVDISEAISSVEPVAIQTFCNNVIQLASMLRSVQRYHDAAALLTKYFVRGKDSYGFTNEQFLKAARFLVSCHKHMKNMQQALEVLEQVHELVKTEPPKGLNMVDRYFIAFDYACLERSQDLHQTFDFHALLCQAESNQFIRLLEVKSFILRVAMTVMYFGDKDEKTWKQGVNFYKRALSLDNPTTDVAQINENAVTWISAFVSLCDMSKISDMDPSESFSLVSFVFFVADEALEYISPAPGQPCALTVILSKIYLDYRRCIHYLDLAVNRHERYLTDTIEFLQQTQVLIHQYFPQSMSALKWISYSIDIAKEAIKKIPLEQRYTKETFITSLILKRKSLLRPHRKENLHISSGLKRIISNI